MHVLVLRFSSIGDVALTVPVLLQCKVQYPEVQLTMVAPKMYRPLFSSQGIHFIEADLKGKHKGAKGLVRLFREIKEQVKPDVVVDLHYVLRTQVLKAQFKFSGTPVFSINKGRKDKKALTRKTDKQLVQLPHTTQRYAQVFEEAGYPLNYNPKQPLLPKYNNAESEAFAKNNAEKQLVGIAPFAAFQGKTWPKDKMKKLLPQLILMGIKPVLFGGPADQKPLEELKDEHTQVEILAGKYNFATEIAIMTHLKAMICMDSSNLHLATLAGIPVVSIWGATHSFAGFGPLGHNSHLQVEVSTENLNCRPCSVFGNKPCFREDYACLHGIEEADVLSKLEAAIREIN